MIDEAGVFLEKRNSLELQRNALVCVKLRLGMNILHRAVMAVAGKMAQAATPNF